MGNASDYPIVEITYNEQPPFDGVSQMVGWLIRDGETLDIAEGWHNGEITGGLEVPSVQVISRRVLREVTTGVVHNA